MWTTDNCFLPNQQILVEMRTLHYQLCVVIHLSWVLESGIRIKESGISLKIVIQNPRLSWLPLLGATTGFDCNYN